MQTNLEIMEQAVSALRRRGMVILFDSDSRENEGDLVIAAEYATPDQINFMLTVARGLLCVPMLPEDLDRIGIPQMVQHNTALHQCAFTVSVDAKSGITTGSSAFDRAHTISLLLNEDSKLSDFAVPGHVFPIRCHPLGLTDGRQGHTEGSIVLMQLAKLKPVSVICEILNEDGTMANRSDLVRLSDKYQIPLIDIQTLVAILEEWY